MAYPVDINRSVFLGVENLRVEVQDSARCWRLHGWQFDARNGFGGEAFDYEGEVAIISREVKLIKSLYIGRYHSSSKSWGWSLETDELPEPPFIITSRLQTNLIFDGEIEMEFNEKGKEMFLGKINPDWVGYPTGYAILGSSGWFGEIITIEGSCSYQLRAYSDSIEQADILNSEIITNDDVAEEMDKLILLEPEEISIEKFKPFGRVTRLLSRSEMSLSQLQS
jgi:hypothetical protein